MRDGSIELKVAPEVSALDYANAVSISGYTIPAISTRKAETQVTVARWAKLRHLRAARPAHHRPARQDARHCVSIPILGQLFKSKGITHSTSELVVIITPTIVHPLDSCRMPAVSEPRNLCCR